MNTSVQVANRKLCRACLRQYESRKDLISLQSFDQTFSSSVKIRFHDMLSSLLNHSLPEADTLPSKICIMCLSSLRVSYYFRLEVEKSQELLLEKARASGSKIVIKQEAVESNNFPVILQPRHVGNETFNDSEIAPMDADDADEIIDYEPDIDSVMDYSDNETSQTPNADTSPSKTSIMSNETESGAYPCDLCDKRFNSYKGLQCHKRCGHIVSKCKYCEKRGNRQQLTLHTKYKHAEKYDEFLQQYSKPELSSPEKARDDNAPVVLINRIEKFHECSSCAVKFVSKLALVKHHADCDNKCIDCGIKIPRKDFYFKHLETVHNYSSIDLSGYECPFCMNLFRTEKILEEHIQRLHPDENQSNADTFSEAGESVDGLNVHQCKICHQSFQSSKSLKQHTTIKHKDPSSSLIEERKSSNVQKYSKDDFFEKFIVQKSSDFYRCVPCKKDIFKRSIPLHVKSKHAAIRPFRCELCSDAFLRSDYRTKHVASIHPNSFKCSTCDVQFDRGYKFDAHMVKHGQAQTIFKPDDGDDCYDLRLQDLQFIEDSTNYDYSNDDLLLTSGSNGNSQQTTDVPLSKDEFCEKYIVNVSDKNCRCNVCNLDIQKNSVVSHLFWKHALEKPLKCSFCNERVVKNAARISHMSKCHPNEYKCPDCNQQFVKHHLLADHIREVHVKKVLTKPSAGEADDLHISEMKFIANRNEDEIIEESDLNININMDASTSSEDKLYACQFCPKKFTSSKNLQIHKSHKHKNDTLPDLETSQSAQDTSYDEPISFDEFKQNWVEKVNSTDLKCLVCEQVMRNKSFSLHMKAKHSTTGAYLCALCPERFYRPDQRIQHMSISHRGIFHCSTCNVQFYKNSRYAKHMSDFHAIEIDSYDSYEVDLGLNDLKFVPFVKKAPDDDQVSHQSSINESDVVDPIEEMMQLISPSEEMSRTNFISRYIKSIGPERHCLACDKVFYASTIYHHLIHFHSTILPFKCPFCDVRFERTGQRMKHLQHFHPDEYKCNECGLQFPKHIKYSEHMSIEHNITVTTPKSPYETKDLSSIELKYVAQKSDDDAYEAYWHDDESSIVNSTAFADQVQADDSEALLNIKADKVEVPTINYVKENDRLIEIPAPSTSHRQMYEDELPYENFKKKYLKKMANGSFKCTACNRMLLKTSVCAHLRMWHATEMIFNCELCPTGFRRGDYRMRHMGLLHPNDYKCSECGTQFYYSVMYKDHMASQHQINVKVQILKKKDQIDVPLGSLKFAPHIPDAVRLHNPEETSAYSAIKKRRESICHERPKFIASSNANNDGLTYKEFFKKFMEPRSDGYKCLACNKILSKLSVKKHCKREHSTTKPYYCQICDSGFYRIDDRMKHMNKDHPDSFKCLMCDVQFYLSTSYIEHMTKEHSMTVNIASNKTKDDIDIPFENLRFKANTPKSTTVDDDGGMVYEDFADKNLVRCDPVNGEQILRCVPCNRSFAAKNKRFHMLQTHSKIKPYGCDLCPMRFTFNCRRGKHMTKHHPNDFVCQMCGTQFETADRYSQHMNKEHQIMIKVKSNPNTDIKTDEMKFYEKLNKPRPRATSDASPMANSSQIDMDETSLHCDICNIDLDSSRSHRQHMRDHTLGIDPNAPKPTEIKVEKEIEKVVECDMCDKKFVNSMARNIHKKFKHGIFVERQKAPNQKFEVVCEICDFTSYRRDYLEHHIKAQHGSEFSCSHCRRILSTYNCYIYHIETNHYTKVDTAKMFQCTDCNTYFKMEENLVKHKEFKHGENPPRRNNFCKLCSMDFKYPNQFATHLETYTHKNMQNFFNGESSRKNSIKDEPVEMAAVSSSKSTNQNEINDNGPEMKRMRKDEGITENDKLEYLKYLQTTESGNFKCGICGKVKMLRKYMLHHLKQHKEIPTYDCDKCPERFVFKTKFDKHMELHESGGPMTALNDSNLINEHPKFQEIRKGPAEIKCLICNMTFKLTIMLNNHNSTWHAVDNPHKDLPMNEQKQKRNSAANGSFVKCKDCKEAFTKFDDLDKHIKDVHSSENRDKVEKTAETSDIFNCDKCSLTFHDKKYLENHQSFFCVNRFQGRATDGHIVNEQ